MKFVIKLKMAATTVLIVAPLVIVASAAKVHGAEVKEVNCEAECFTLDQGTGHMYFDSTVSSRAFTRSSKLPAWSKLMAQCPSPAMLMQRVFVKFTQRARDGQRSSATQTDDGGTYTDDGYEYDMSEVRRHHSEDEQYSSNGNRQKFRLIKATVGSACTISAPLPVRQIGGSLVGG